MPTRIQSVSLSQNSTLKSSKRFIQKRTKTVCVCSVQKLRKCMCENIPRKPKIVQLSLRRHFAVRYIYRENLYTRSLSFSKYIKLKFVSASHFRRVKTTALQE